MLFVSLCCTAYRFLFDGNRVNDTDTPESLEMVSVVVPISPDFIFLDVRVCPFLRTQASIFFVLHRHSCSCFEAILVVCRRRDPGILRSIACVHLFSSC